MAVAANDTASVVWLDEDATRMLCAHIVRKAAKDYYKCCLQSGKWESEGRKRQLREFFESEYFKFLSGIDGRMLMRIVEYRAKHHIKLFRGGDFE